MTKVFSLNGGWKFRAIDRYGKLPPACRKALHWMKAVIPGTVHTDLMSGKIIHDPFYRTNELDVQWVETQQWEYRRDFTIRDDFLREDRIFLVAEGLDTYGSIRINGRPVGTTANMFITHTFDVKKLLRRGTNRIEIVFDSPTMRSRKLEQRYGPLQVVLEPHRVYVRKAQYSFGWDWGPKLTTSGIWRNISLRAYSGGSLRNPFVKVLHVDRKSALLEISVETESLNSKACLIRSYVGGWDESVEREIPVVSPTTRFQVRVKNPRLWWPNGSGSQPMYTCLLTLLQDGQELDQAEIPFAIRTIRLVQIKDAEGRSFQIEVNGVKIYCKGADWIPADSFLPRIPDEKYQTLLQLSRNAHMNMIRVWGGGIYEDEKFYTLCDELGLMIWHDFMFACGEYPKETWFMNQVRSEAQQVVQRLRNHPSIVLWCGNNECEWLYCTEHPGASPDDMTGSKIFRELLPQVCRTLDGTRPYWRSSPFGSGFPNDESNGNHHQWTVWSYWKDYKEYENDRARFVSEFGFQAPANRRTFEEVTRREDRHPQSPVMEHHNKQTEGTERLLRFQAAHYRLTDTFDEFIHQGQLVQADALKYAVEHWRRRKFLTAGSLFWQLNDCWPVSSWAVIDAALRPKAAYYAAKRFFQPVLLSFKRGKEGIECWATNDLFEEVKAEAYFILRSFHGKTLWKKRVPLRIPRNRSIRFFVISEKVLKTADPRTVYVTGVLSVSGKTVSENRFFFTEPKHWMKKEGNISVRIVSLASGKFSASFRSNTFVRGVRFEISGEDIIPDDNYFDLDPGIRKDIYFTSSSGIKDIRKNIRLEWI